MSVPKVGDRVRILVDNPSGCPLRAGDERVIKFSRPITLSVRRGKEIVAIERIQLKTDDNWFVHDDQVEVIS